MSVVTFVMAGAVIGIIWIHLLSLSRLAIIHQTSEAVTFLPTTTSQSSMNANILKDDRSPSALRGPESDIAHSDNERCILERGWSGKWVLDWDYAKRTDYPMHGSYADFHIPQQNFTPSAEQPYRLATAWTWHDDSGCPIIETTLDSMCHICSILGITKILVVGDSLSYEFRTSLLSLLGSPPTLYGFEQSKRPVTVQCPSIVGSSLTSLSVLWSRVSPIADLRYLAQNRSNNWIEDWVDTNPNRTAIILNVGLWMKDLEEFRLGVNYAMKWIDRFETSKIIAFYRNALPGHAGCEPSNGSDVVEGKAISKAVRSFDWAQLVNVTPYHSYHDYKRASANRTSFNWAEAESYNNYAWEVLANRSGDNRLAKVHWFNVFNITVLRRDGHIGFGDCVHYALPGPIDWWVHLFHSMLFDMARLHLASNNATLLQVD